MIDFQIKIKDIKVDEVNYSFSYEIKKNGESIKGEHNSTHGYKSEFGKLEERLKSSFALELVLMIDKRRKQC